MTHPQNSTGCYLLMDCQILQGDENIVIWGNSDREYEEVAIPLNVCFQKGEKHQIEIILDHNCPWYDIRDSVPSPVLQPITFDVTVEDWKEQA